MHQSHTHLPQNSSVQQIEFSFGFLETDYTKQVAVELTNGAFEKFFNTLRMGIADQQKDFYSLAVRASIIASPPIYCTDLFSQGVLRDQDHKTSPQLTDIVGSVLSLKEQYINAISDRHQEMVRYSLILDLKLSSDVIWDTFNGRLGSGLQLLSDLTFRDQGDPIERVINSFNHPFD